MKQRRAGEIPDTLVLVEHEPVYTLGRSAKEEHLLLTEMEIKRQDIDVVRIGRGGDVTFHGPGQLVGYPILDLGVRARGLSWYVTQLEEVLIRTVADFGVTAGRDDRNRGVWIDNNKIAAIGLRISHGVTTHGIALNVGSEVLEYFRHINSCGVKEGVGDTSMEQVLGRSVDIEEVTNKLIEALKAHLRLDLKKVRPEEVWALLPSGSQVH